MGSFNNLTGTTYSRLMAIHRVPNEGGHTTWRCLCDCGTLVNVRAQHLRNGNTKSCGCLDYDTLIARSTTHGMCGTPTYESWKGMIQRCDNPANTSRHLYGGRGVRVDSRWYEFSNFYADMGDRPSGKTLDRIDVDGDYKKSNCRWATPEEQARNKRSNRWISFHHQRLTLSQWAAKFSVRPSTLHKKIGLHGEHDALTYYVNKTKGT